MKYFYESQKERADKALNDLKDTNKELDITEKINNKFKDRITDISYSIFITLYFRNHIFLI